MISKEKIIMTLCVAGTLFLCGTTAIVYANSEEPEVKTVDVRHISWVVPDEYKNPDTVVEYDVEVEESQYQFNPNVYISTADDNLTNYATPISNTWSLQDVEYMDYEAPDVDTDSKTFMRFQHLGYSEGNKQSSLCRGTYAYTGDYNIRMVDGRYLVALGTYYTKTIGQYVDIQLENGTVLPCVLGDTKSDDHTDETHRYQKWDKSIMEFIVDSPIVNEGDGPYDSFRRTTGIQHNFAELEVFNSKVKTIRVYDKVVPYVMGDTSHDNPDLY